MPAAGAKISLWRMPFVEILKVQMLVVTEEKGLKALSRDAFPARLSRFKQNIARLLLSWKKIRASRGAFQDSVFALNSNKIRASRGAFPNSVFAQFPQTLRARTDGDGELRINCSCPKAIRN